MRERFDPDSLDLAQITRSLRVSCGAFVEGAIVGRTLLRDQIADQVGCSLLVAEQIVDTLILRGFLLQSESLDGRTGWQIGRE
jgi:hypothetical protein